MLTHLFPRPLPIELGEPRRPFFALPLRVRDLADLEALALMAGLRCYEQPPEGDIGDLDYRNALRRAVDIAEAGAEGWGSSGCRDIVFGTLGGRAVFLRLVLREHEGFGEAEALALVPTITSTQWEALDRLAFGVDPLKEIVVRIDREIGIAIYPDETVPWPKAIIETWQKTGIPLKEIAELTIPQLRLIRSGGNTDAAWGDFDLDNNADHFAVYSQEIAPKREAFYGEGNIPGVAWNDWEKLLPKEATPMPHESNGQVDAVAG